MNEFHIWIDALEWQEVTGWTFLFLSGILAVILVFQVRSGGDKEDIYYGAIVMSACWVLGCLFLFEQLYWYLYIVNVLLAGKLIFTQFTGKKWG